MGTSGISICLLYSLALRCGNAFVEKGLTRLGAAWGDGDPSAGQQPLDAPLRAREPAPLRVPLDFSI
jgi:hypothetical protein